jgi:putative Mg2+ transporter-C (MgtC) family protein
MVTSMHKITTTKMMKLYPAVVVLLFATLAIPSCNSFQVPCISPHPLKRWSSPKFAQIREIRQSNRHFSSTNEKASGSINTVSRGFFLKNKRTLLFVGSVLSWFLLLGRPNVAWATDAIAATATAVTIPATVAAKSIIAPQISVQAELQLIARLIFAAVSGSVVGWERSASKHSAGVRTMALVSLGAAAFTICSAYGFAGKCDPSRMAANVASGVGFLGAGVITTQARMTKTESYNIVHGLTTAAAIWLSAALGVASAVGLYLTSAATTLTTVAILRLGKAPEKREELVSDQLRPMMQQKQIKNIAKYQHRSTDTIDTSGWDEQVQKQAAVEPPGLVGDAMATSLRKPRAILPDDWMSLRFENQTISITDVPQDLVFQQNYTNATLTYTP